ncbi:cupin domain-containing protein [Mucilaginibacter sp.]|uniref:cupin domain-containing protein n=1 Tax=Mucilaginibacter sp. TaxID=1882438 RepID=UPI003263F42E
MDEKEYIKSGILETYCTGALNATEQQEVLRMCALYPAIKQELEEIQLVIEQLALSFAVTPRPELRERILNAAFNTPTLDLNNLPLTDSSSDLDTWLKALFGLIPQEHTEPFYHHLLRHDDQVTQALVVSKVNIPDETHSDLIESFFILEGSCRCLIDGQEHILHAGDFLEIPLHQHHDVVLLTPYVVAIHQQRALRVA